MNLSVNIKMSGPLCRCKEPKLRWGIDPDYRSKQSDDILAAMFVIECTKCRAEYRIPQGSFHTDIDYPGRPTKKVRAKEDGAQPKRD